MWVYDTRTKSLVRRFDTGLCTNTFISDLAFDRTGNAYFTDSLTPILWRVPAKAVRKSTKAGTAERFLDFTGTALQYQTGFNLNGITPEKGGRSLLTVQSNTGKLFRIDLLSRKVTEIALQGGGSLPTGDGILFLGSKLLVVQHVVTETSRFEAVVTVTLHGNTGRITSTYTDPTFRYPTTTATTRNRLLVVNAKFDRRNARLPAELPFTVSGVPLQNH